MSNIKLKTLILKSPPQRVMATVPMVSDMDAFIGAGMKLYAASMRLESGIERMPSGFAALLRGYYAAQGVITKTVLRTKEHVGFTGWLGNKSVVCLTGGKDSVLMLIEEIEKRGVENVIALYVNGVNRSEQSYERTACGNITDYLGVQLIIVQCTISGVLNRSNNNIGMRDQLIIIFGDGVCSTTRGQQYRDGEPPERIYGERGVVV